MSSFYNKLHLFLLCHYWRQILVQRYIQRENLRGICQGDEGLFLPCKVFNVRFIKESTSQEILVFTSWG